MESRSSDSGERIPIWTPAPGYSSPPSPDSSQLSWEKGTDEDFESQMDENGIIGLREDLEEMDEEEVVLKEEEDLLLDAETPEPEEGPPPALANLSCHLSELLDSEPLSQHTRDDFASPSCSKNGGDDIISLVDWSDEDEQKHAESPESLEDRRPQLNTWALKHRVLSIADARTEEVEEPLVSLQEEIDPQKNCTERHVVSSNKSSNNLTTSINRRTTLETIGNSQNGLNEEHVFSPLSTTNISHSPVLPNHLQTANYGTDTFETYQVPACTQSLAESHSSRLSCAPRTYLPARFEEEQHEYTVTPQIITSSILKEDDLEKNLGSHHTYQQSPVPSPRKINSTPQEYCQSSSLTQHTAKVESSSSESSPLSTPHHRRHRGHRPSKTSRTDLKDVRKGHLSHPLPDFSKVEPRVRFPKSGYKPPMSRRPPRKTISKLEAPLVLKSPADIVREVLLSSTEGLSDNAAPDDPQRLMNCTVPEEFRCPLQASALVQQLQEDYNRLLTKYAEAENTIDRLRLEAKVGLYSDLPKPSQSVVPSIVQEASKVMTLSFPQAQRAELSSNTVQPTQERIHSECSRGTPTCPSPVDSGSSRRPVSAVPLTKALSIQAQKFQQQVDDFEELLKSGKSKLYELKEGLSQLAQGQDSLERAYLAARHKHQQLQKQSGGRSSHFDPNRDLEGLIFSSGLRLEELKDRMEQSEQNSLPSEPTPNPPLQAHQTCASVNENEPHPVNPISAAQAEDKSGLEVTSVSEVSDGDREEVEVLSSFLHPLHQKHQHVEKDFGSLMDRYHNFREMPKLLDRGLCKEDHDSLKFRSTPPLSRNDRIEDRQPWRTKDEGDSRKQIQSSPTADSLTCPSSSPQACNSMDILPPAALSTTVLPRQHDREERLTGSQKYHSGLRESDSKECDRVLRTPIQDGVISPETDSGFVGSEIGPLTPAVHSPVQQKAALSVTRPSVTQGKCRIKPETVSVSGQSPLGSPAHAQASPGSRKKTTQTGKRFLPSPSTSSSPLLWPRGPHPPWPFNGTSELEQQSDSGEEGRQADHYIKPANQEGCYLKSPSSAVPCHHGDHLKSQSSVLLMKHHEALQSLQEEVDKLQKRLEGSLRMTSPPRPIRTASAVLEDINRKPCQTSTPLKHNFRSWKQRAANIGGTREGKRSEEEERGRATKRLPRRSSSVPRFRAELDLTTDSELGQPEPRTVPHITPSPAGTHMSRRVRAKTGRIIETGTNRQRSLSADRSDEGDDEAEGSRGPAPLCSCCMAGHGSRTSARAPKKYSSSCHTLHYSKLCSLCGTRVSWTANQNSTQKETQPLNSTRRERGKVYLAAAPSPSVLSGVHVLQCVPITPSLLYYPSPVMPSSFPEPFYLSHSEDRRQRSRSRGHHRRSHSVDTQHSLRSSLDRAIAAASSIQKVSQRMARSLASGLQHTSPLA